MNDAQPHFETSIDLVRRGDLRGALDALLATLRLDPRHAGALSAAGRLCRLLGSEADARLFEAVEAAPEDASARYALAFRLVDQARPDVAVPQLQACLDADPGDPAVRRELAYAQLQSGAFRDCLDTLEPICDAPELSETERLDVQLTRAEAALLARDRELCADLLAECDAFDADDEQRERLDALHGQLGRSRRWPALDELGLREWHFIQHAGVILKVAGGYFEDGSRQGRYDVLDLRLDMVAFLLQRLAHLLERLGLLPDAFAPASPAAAPLAHALALALDRRVETAEEAGRRGSTLLLAADAAELGAHAGRLAEHRPELRAFALNLPWDRGQPVCPEVVGVLARRVLLPWEERYALDSATGAMRTLPADARGPEVIGRELAAAMAALPDDGGTAREEFEALYMPLAVLLLLGNDGLHPARRRFTSLSPCRGTDDPADDEDGAAGD